MPRYGGALRPAFDVAIVRGAINTGAQAGASIVTVTLEQAAGQADPSGDALIDFDVVFSEPVTGFTGADVTLTGSANPSLAFVTDSGDHMTYTLQVTGMTGPGTVTAALGSGAGTSIASLLPSSPSTSVDNTVTYTGGPTVTINQGGSQIDPINYGPIVFDVVFAMSVTGFATGDVALSGTAGATTATVTGSGANYTVTVGGMTGEGTVIATIAAGVATGGGNVNNASTSTDNTVTYVCLDNDNPFTDDFNRPNTSPAVDALGACWDMSQPIGSPARYWNITSTRLVSNLGSGSQTSRIAEARHNIVSPTTWEFDLIQMNGIFIGVAAWLRADSTFANGYRAFFENISFGGTGFGIEIAKVVAGVQTVIGSASVAAGGSGGASPIQPGRIRFTAIGTALKVDTKPLAGAYTNRLSIVDATFASGDHVGLERFSNVSNNFVHLDNASVS